MITQVYLFYCAKYIFFLNFIYFTPSKLHNFFFQCVCTIEKRYALKSLKNDVIWDVSILPFGMW